MKNVLTICAIALLCQFSTHAQDCFSYAGEDSRTCNFQDTLIGSPSGGEWLFPCINSSQTISMNTLNDSSVVVTYLECGTYVFEYSISTDSCFAVDTVEVDFENPSVANYNVEMDIELDYLPYDCQADESTSCSDNHEILGAAPEPIWSFTPYGSCQSNLFIGLPVGSVDSCLVDSIFIAESNFTGVLDSTMNLNLNFQQNEVITLDSNEMVVGNNFFNLMDQTHGVGVGELIDDCPAPMLCHVLPPECLDTLFDTLTVVVPVHLGGHWTVFENGTFIELDSNYNFMLDTFTYWLNVQPSIETYNASFTLKEIDFWGDTIGITNTADLTLKWEEEWTSDTISRIYTLVTVRDSCCKGGTYINRPDPILPDSPVYDCPGFTLTFIPEMKTTDPEIICGDSTYVISVDISDGIPPYDFDGIEGSINGDIFTSDPIPADSVHFSFNIFDSGECNDLIEGDNCICLAIDNTPNFDLTITEDCGLEGNGTLLVEHISDGYAPFLYSITQAGFYEDTLFQNLEFGNYKLAVQDSFTCVTNIEFYVEPQEWEFLDEFYEEKELCGLEDIRLELPLPDSTLGDYFIQWENGDTASFKTINIANTYTATIYIFSTCQQYEVTFDVEDLYLFDEDDIKLPNAFTPNGDGLNDGFIPLLDNRMEVVSYSLGVFNRWGNRVFYSNNHEEIWEPEGQDASDVYIWFLDMKVKNCHGEIILVKRSGDLTLIQ